MSAEAYDRIKAWNREHPEQRYGSLSNRAKRDVERGRRRPLIFVVAGWFAMSVWRIVCLVIAIALILLILWLLSKTGPGCQASQDLCIY